MDIDPRNVNIDACENDSMISYYDWIADSRTTCHLTNQKEILENFKEEESIIEGMGKVIAISKGRGNVMLQSLIKGEKHTIILEDVCYVPKATNSLLSIGLFDESGGLAIIQGGKMELLMANKAKIAEADRIDCLYVLNMKLHHGKMDHCYMGRYPKKLMERMAREMGTHILYIPDENQKRINGQWF